MYELHFYWGLYRCEKWMECVPTQQATHTWHRVHFLILDQFHAVTAWTHRLWKSAGPSSLSDPPCVFASCPEPSSPAPQKKKCGHIPSTVVPPVCDPTQMKTDLVSALQLLTLQLRRCLFLRSVEGSGRRLAWGLQSRSDLSVSLLQGSCRCQLLSCRLNSPEGRNNSLSSCSLSLSFTRRVRNKLSWLHCVWVRTWAPWSETLAGDRTTSTMTWKQRWLTWEQHPGSGLWHSSSAPLAPCWQMGHSGKYHSVGPDRVLAMGVETGPPPPFYLLQTGLRKKPIWLVLCHSRALSLFSLRDICWSSTAKTR